MFSLHRSDETDVPEIAVSYDGTWSKRGYTTNIGVGFVISVENGKVLDFDFESKLCSECTSAKKDLGEDSAEYAICYGGHKDECTQTHIGSSGLMECSIAKKIWDRSKDSNLHYKFMISVGYSIAYGTTVSGILMVAARIVQKRRILISGRKSTKNGASRRNEVWKESHESGKAECARVSKLESIGHVQKRMGTHLRQLRKKQPKLKDGKSVKVSKHRLTDKTLDKIQTYYGNAIRANVKPGTLTPQEQNELIEVMQKAILAVLYHTCEISDKKERHQPRPQGLLRTWRVKNEKTLVKAVLNSVVIGLYI